MPIIENSTLIQGVQIVHLQAFGDTRGRFMESFRKEWFPQRSWVRLQCNRSDSAKGVVRGLHYHHKQIDYWYVVAGRIRAAMVDIRPFSPTYLAAQTVDMGADNNLGLFIPIGVAHGFATLSDATLTYVVDNYYDGGRDENGVAWNDPTFNIDWGIENPIVSARDQQNKMLKDIPADELPKE